MPVVLLEHLIRMKCAPWYATYKIVKCCRWRLTSRYSRSISVKAFLSRVIISNWQAAWSILSPGTAHVCFYLYIFMLNTERIFQATMGAIHSVHVHHVLLRHHSTDLDDNPSLTVGINTRLCCLCELSSDRRISNSHLLSKPQIWTESSLTNPNSSINHRAATSIVD